MIVMLNGLVYVMLNLIQHLLKEIAGQTRNDGEVQARNDVILSVSVRQKAVFTHENIKFNAWCVSMPVLRTELYLRCLPRKPTQLQDEDSFSDFRDIIMFLMEAMMPNWPMMSTQSWRMIP